MQTTSRSIVKQWKIKKERNAEGQRQRDRTKMAEKDESDKDMTSLERNSSSWLRELCPVLRSNVAHSSSSSVFPSFVP